VGGLAHEQIGEALATVLGRNAKIDQLDHVAVGNAGKEEDGQRVISLTENKPEVGIEIAGGFVAGEDVADIAQAVERGTVETVLIGAEDGLSEKVMGLGRVGLPVAIVGQVRGVKAGRDRSLEIEQLREVFEGTVLKNGKEGVGFVIEEDLDEVDASLVGVGADGFDQLASGVLVEGGGDAGWGENEHGASGADNGQDGTDELVAMFGDPGTAEVGFVSMGQVEEEFRESAGRHTSICLSEYSQAKRPAIVGVNFFWGNYA
jgi:hypothetical protein